MQQKSCFLTKQYSSYLDSVNNMSENKRDSSGASSDILGTENTDTTPTSGSSKKPFESKDENIPVESKPENGATLMGLCIL